MVNLVSVIASSATMLLTYWVLLSFATSIEYYNHLQPSGFS